MMIAENASGVNSRAKADSDPEIFRKLFDHLSRGGKYAHYWIKAGNRSQWFAVDNFQTFPQAWAGLDVYFGVHPCTGIPPTNAKGEKKEPESVRSQIEYIAALNGLYAEYDAKDWEGGKAAILAHLDNFPHIQGWPFPSVIVDSGGGYHAYWLSEHTFDVHSSADRQHAADLQEAWVKLVGGDASVHDLTRVLRVPGTKNFKPQYGPNFPAVTVVEADFRRRYQWHELEFLTADIRSQIDETRHQNSSSPQSLHSPQLLTIDDQQLIQKAMSAPFNGVQFSGLWRGDRSFFPVRNGKPDQSGADQSLINLLAFWTGKDEERMDRLFRQSGLMRDKWERKDYREMTLQGAVRGVRNVYDPSRVNDTSEAVRAAQAAIGMSTATTNGAGAHVNGTGQTMSTGTPNDHNGAHVNENGPKMSTGGGMRETSRRTNPARLAVIRLPNNPTRRGISQHTQRWDANTYATIRTRCTVAASGTDMLVESGHRSPTSRSSVMLGQSWTAMWEMGFPLQQSA